MEYHQQRYARTLDRYVTPGCRWLDIGAGARLHGGWGTHDPRAITARAGRLVGIDVVAEHLAANPFLTEFRVCRAEAMPFPDAAFDLVTANMVLEHLADPAAVFREVRRVLCPGGRFVAMTPYRFHPVVLAADLLLPRPVRSLAARISEGRKAEHIFPTMYRCNTIGAIGRTALGTGWAVETLDAFQSFPFARGWLGKVEASLKWRSNVLVVLLNPPAPGGH